MTVARPTMPWRGVLTSCVTFHAGCFLQGFINLLKRGFCAGFKLERALNFRVRSTRNSVVRAWRLDAGEPESPLV